VHVDLAIAAYGVEFPDEGAFPDGLYLRAEIARLHGAEEWKRGADEAAVALFQSAVVDLTGVIAKERRRWPAYVLRSELHQSLGDLPHAFDDAVFVVREFPVFWHGHARLCEVLTTMGKFEEAIREYHETFRLGAPPKAISRQAVDVLRQHGLQ
jgi:hypothetical protein